MRKGLKAQAKGVRLENEMRGEVWKKIGWRSLFTAKRLHQGFAEGDLD